MSTDSQTDDYIQFGRDSSGTDSVLYYEQNLGDYNQIGTFLIIVEPNNADYPSLTVMVTVQDSTTCASTRQIPGDLTASVKCMAFERNVAEDLASIGKGNFGNTPISSLRLVGEDCNSVPTITSLNKNGVSTDLFNVQINQSDATKLSLTLPST